MAMNDRAKHFLILAGILYAGVGAVTFGHAAANSDRNARAEYEQCQTRSQLHFEETGGYLFCFKSDLAPMDGMFAAIGWPLYWSWEFFNE